MNKNVSVKRIAALLSAGILLMAALTGCTSGQNFGVFGKEQYETSCLDLFDTVTVIKGYAESEEVFTRQAEEMLETLERFHQYTDIYHSYDGINNLRTVNENAGIQEVEVSPELIAFLEFCKEAYQISGGKVNVFMGSVLELWHEARETASLDPSVAYIPEKSALEEAAKHTDPENVLIDAEKNTVFITDPAQRIDAGAIAKGYAAQKAIEETPEGYVLNLGGNICISGPKADGSGWIVGVQEPDSENYLNRMEIKKGAVVTSGDYQRYFELNGKRYHHIIDPETLMPSEKWRSVTVISQDSGIADFLSTALFLMNREEGTRLLEQYSSEAFWIAPNGSTYQTDGFAEYLK